MHRLYVVHLAVVCLPWRLLGTSLNLLLNNRARNLSLQLSMRASLINACSDSDIWKHWRILRAFSLHLGFHLLVNFALVVLDNVLKMWSKIYEDSSHSIKNRGQLSSFMD